MDEQKVSIFYINNSQEIKSCLLVSLTSIDSGDNNHVFPRGVGVEPTVSLHLILVLA